MDVLALAGIFASYLSAWKGDGGAGTRLALPVERAKEADATVERLEKMSIVRQVLQRRALLLDALAGVRSDPPSAARTAAARRRVGGLRPRIGRARAARALLDRPAAPSRPRWRRMAQTKLAVGYDGDDARARRSR